MFPFLSSASIPEGRPRKAVPPPVGFFRQDDTDIE